MWSRSIEVLHKALDASIMRQKVIAQNIANIETPGYKRKEVLFEKYLAKALYENEGMKLKTTKEGHISEPSTLDEVKPVLIKDEKRSIRQDGNNVDIDYELTRLMENSLHYQTLSRLLNTIFDRYNTVIRGIR